MLDIFLEPLQYGFMQRAIAMAIIIGSIGALMGSYLMVQGLALMGEAIGHSVLPGLAIAFLLGANIFVGAFVAGMLSTFLITWVRTRSPLKEGASMGIVYSAFFALGITLITIIQKDNKIDLNHFLFGNILGVTSEDLRATALVACLAIAAIVLLYKELFFLTFDPLGAKSAGLPVDALNFGLMTLVGLTVVASLKAVGVVMVVALLITPGATAYLLVARLHQMMILGAAIGVLASVSGMYLSYWYNLPSGPAIVLVAFGLFCLSFLFSPRQGAIVRSWEAYRARRSR